MTTPPARFAALAVSTLCIALATVVHGWTAGVLAALTGIAGAVYGTGSAAARR